MIKNCQNHMSTTSSNVMLKKWLFKDFLNTSKVLSDNDNDKEINDNDKGLILLKLCYFFEVFAPSIYSNSYHQYFHIFLFSCLFTHYDEHFTGVQIENSGT